jgi:pilus assembly protein CpaC
MRISAKGVFVAYCAAHFVAGSPRLGAQTVPAGDAVAASIPTKELGITVGKSIIVDSTSSVVRVAVANPDLVETVAITPHEVLINGKAPGQTTMIVWTEGGGRRAFELNVSASSSRLEALRAQLAHEFPGQAFDISLENDNVFLRGTAKDLTSAQRAVTIAGTLGKVINLMRVEVPSMDPQILLKVRFADVDRSLSDNFSFNLFSTGAGNTLGSTSTGQTAAPTITGGAQNGLPSSKYTLSQALNIFLFRNDLNLGATIQALQTKGLLQILAEPNLLTTDGKEASFLSGGEFPYPTVQGGAVAGAVTIQFRKYGISIDFLPHITPRGTIRMQVTPEVSSLDFSNAVVISGFTIPALTTRRVSSEVELSSGQSFAIAGLLDNQITETLSKIPGLSSIPLFGKLFESHSRTTSNTELLVLITPELVKSVPYDQAPQLEMPKEFISGIPKTPPSTPGPAVTGPVPGKPVLTTMPLEDLIENQKLMKGTTTAPAAPSAPSISNGSTSVHGDSQGSPQNPSNPGQSPAPGGGSGQ